MTSPDNPDRVGRELARRAERLTTAMREFETLSLAVYHDFRPALDAIASCVRTMTDGERELDAETRQVAQVMRDALGQLHAMIDNLGGLCRAASRPMDLRTVDMERLAREAWSALSSTHGIAFTLGKLPETRGEPEMLKLVWTNLLSNAITRCGDRERPVIEVAGGGGGGFSVYSVRDNGRDLNLHFAGRLYHVFEEIQKQSQHAGIGVALAIVQRIVTRHRGNVWVERAPDRGVIFQFSIGELLPEASAG